MGKLDDRLAGFGKDVVQNMPFTVGKLVTGPASDDHVAKIGAGLGMTIPWVQQRDKFAGIPGSLSYARSRALVIQDPAIKGQALSLLNGIQALPEAQQHYLNSVLQDPQGAMEAAGFTSSDQFQADIQQLLPQATIGDNGEIGLPGESGSIPLAVAIYTLFPSLRGHVNVAGGDEATYGGAAAGDFGGWFDQTLGDVADSAKKARMELDHKGMIGALGEVITKGGAALALPLKYGAEAFGWGSRAAGLGAITDVVAAETKWGEEKMGGAFNAVSKPVVEHAFGVHPGDPGYDSAVSGVSTVLQILTFHGATEALGDIKTVRSTPVEFADKTVGSTAEPLPETTGAQITEGVLHPFRGLDAVIGDVVKNVFGKSPEEWVQMKGMQRFFDHVEAVKTDASIADSDKLQAVKNIYGEAMDEKTVQKMLETPRDQMPSAYVDHLRDTKTELQSIQERLPVVRDRLREIDSQSAASNRASSIQAMQDRITELKDSLESGEMSDNESLDVQAELSRVRARLSDLVREERSVSDLAAERATLEGQLRSYTESPPTIKTPPRATLRAALRGEATTPLEKTIRLVYNGARRAGLDPAKLVDELPQKPRFWNWFKDDSPYNAKDLNADTITKIGRLMKMPDSIVRSAVAAMREVSSDQELFEWLNRWKQLVDASLPKDTPPSIRAAATQMFDAVTGEKTKSFLEDRYTNGRGQPEVGKKYVLSDVDETGNQIPLPSRPTELMGHQDLPDVSRMMDATNATRIFLRRLGESGKVGRLAAGAVQLVQKTLQVSTSIFKPLILGTRAPAMAMRMQMEQALRSAGFGFDSFVAPNGIALFPGGIPVPFSSMRLFKGLFGDDGLQIIRENPSQSMFVGPDDPNIDVGTIHGQLADRGEPVTIADRTAEFNSRTGATPKKIHYEGVRTALEQAHADWLDRWISEDINEPVEVLREKLLGSNDPRVRQDMAALLENVRRTYGEEMDVTEAVDRWLSDRQEYVKSITNGGDSRYLDAIRTGKLAPPEGYRYTSKPTVDSIGHELRDRVSTLSEASESLMEGIRRAHAEGDFTAVEALREELDKTLQKLQDYVDRSGGEVYKYERSPAKLENKRAIRAMIKRDYEKGTYQFPDYTSVEHRVLDPLSGNSVEAFANDTARAWSRMWYSTFKPVEWADLKGTRGSLYYQAAEERFAELTQLGYDRASAKAIAQMDAATKVRDVMYDLSARTSAQRALKDIFWFAPATQEILYTWLGKIPAQSYWAAGAPLLALKANAYVNALRSFGMVEKDQYGDDILRLPEPTAKLLNAIGAVLPGNLKVPDEQYFKLNGFNMVSGQPFPTLATIPGAMLQKAQMKFGGPFKWLGEKLLYQGGAADITMTPQTVTYAWEALFGAPPPFEFLSPGALHRQFDMAKQQSLQYAAFDLEKQGVNPPLPENFPTHDAYVNARDAYTKRLMTLSDGYFHGTAAANFFGSAFTPAKLYSTSSDRAAYMRFLTTKVLPLDPNNETAGWDEKQQALINDYFAGHPGAVIWSVSGNEYDGRAEKDLPFDPSDDERYYTDYYTGLKQVKTPEEFSLDLMAAQVRRHYTIQLDEAFAKMAPDGKASTLLNNWYQHSTALTNYKEEYDRFLQYNPDIRARIQNQQEEWAHSENRPLASFEAQRAATLMDYMKQVAGWYTGDSGKRPAVIAELMQRAAQDMSQNGQYGPPTTALDKDLDWYFHNVIEGYTQQTDPIYREIANAKQAGQDTSAFYDQLQAINAQYAGGQSHNGQQFPSPEEFFYNALSPPAQKTNQYSWATRPVSWLSPFQREKVGYTTWEGEDDFLANIASIQQQASDYMTQNSISPTSSQGIAIANWETTTEQKAAQAAGPEAVQTLALENGPPIDRLQVLGYGEDNPLWAQTVEAAKNVYTNIQNAGYQPDGYSAYAMEQKTWLERIIEQQRDEDKAYNALWTRLGSSLPLPGQEGREGVLLYEAVLFGKISAAYPPPTEFIQGVTPSG